MTNGNSASLDAAGIQRILEERARRLARAAADEVALKTIPLVELALGEERFGVNLHQVQEVQPLKGLTPVPGIGGFWAGVVNLRGRLYPVLDLRRYLRLPAAGPPEGGQIVVVAAAGLHVALWTSDVLGVRQVPHDDIQPSMLEPRGASRNIVAGVTADLLAMLDLDLLLSDPSLAVHEEGSRNL
jgi:purine-binding chemotaxis protein CheW